MEQQAKPTRKKTIWIIIAAILVLILAIVAFVLLRASQPNPVPVMTFEQCLTYTTKDTPNAKIGVVVLENGAANISFFGNNGERIPYDAYEFEIGSLTKTITAALVMRAAGDGSLQLSDTIDRFLKLPDQEYYPTIQRLLMHQSGYKSHYFARPMAKNFFAGKNSFYGVSRGSVRRSIGKVHLQDRDYPFSYSNFGYSVLGLLLEEVYQMRYTDLANLLVQQELGMQHTHISGGEGNLSGYWNWAEDDAYIPAGALISTADDMAIYARALLKGYPELTRADIQAALRFAEASVVSSQITELVPA